MRVSQTGEDLESSFMSLEEGVQPFSIHMYEKNYLWRILMSGASVTFI